MHKKMLLSLALVIGLAPGTHAQDDLGEVTITVVPPKAPTPESVTNRIELPRAPAAAGREQKRARDRAGSPGVDGARKRGPQFGREAERVRELRDEFGREFGRETADEARERPERIEKIPRPERRRPPGLPPDVSPPGLDP